MKKQLNEQFIRMQKLAGIITENQINEAKKINLTPVQKKEFFNAIKDLSAQEDFEYALGEAGNVLANILTNGEAEYIEDVEDFGYDADEVEQYAMNLAGESKLNKNQINEVEMDKEALMSQFEEQWKDHSQEYLDLVGTNPIYKGLDAVVNNPKVKQETFDWAYNLTAEDEDEDALEGFGGYVQDGIDYEIMQAFAPQLAKNLIAAGFTYDKGEDIWTVPQSYLDKMDGMFDYSKGATSYGIIWDIWNMDYDTSPREVISDYLEDAAKAL